MYGGDKELVVSGHMDASSSGTKMISGHNTEMSVL